MGSLIPNSLISFVALLFGISVLVQALQELYKYLSNNKSRAYAIAMRDYMGALFTHVLSSHVVQDTRVRGAIQKFSFRPKDHVLPLNKEQLQQALETTIASWKKKLLDALRNEVALQQGVAAAPSPEWQNLIAELQKAAGMKDLALSTADVEDFLRDWKQLDASVNTFNAATLLKAFEQRFMGDIHYYIDNYENFNSSFEYQYKRRNMRLSFVIALLLTLVCNLPIQQIYKAAQTMNEGQALSIINQFDTFQKNIEKRNNENSGTSGNAANGNSVSSSASTQNPNSNANNTAKPDSSSPAAKETKDATLVDGNKKMTNDSTTKQMKAMTDSAFNKGLTERKDIIKAVIDSLHAIDNGIGGLFDTRVPCIYLCGISSKLFCCDTNSAKDTTKKDTATTPATDATKKNTAASSQSTANITDGRSKPLPFGMYIFGCLITAVSVSFGAPLLNNLADMVTRMKNPTSSTKKSGGSDAA